MSNIQNISLVENTSPPPTPPPLASSPLHLEHNCQSCEHADNSNMVQCDECDEWHHYQCVNVTDSIQNLPWFCPKCTSQMYSAPSTSLPHRTPPSQDVEPKNNHYSEVSQINKNYVPNSNRDLDSRNSTTALDKTIHRSNQYPNTICEAENMLVIELQKLEEERILKERRDNEYLQKKYELMRTMATCSYSKPLGESSAQATKIIAPDDKVASAYFSQTGGQTIKFNATANIRNGPASSGAVPKVTQATRHIHRSHEAQQGRRDFEETSADRQGFKPFDPLSSSNSTAIPNATISNSNREYNVASSKQHINDQLDILPRSINQQLVSRIALQKDLPTFCGNVEDWPLFINSFENSTRSCGFTNDENLLRLQRCLKGDALTAVKARLLYPSQVPNIIKTLRMLFGKPEAIVTSMMDKIRSEPAPKADRLDSLIPFALSVQNLTTTIESNNLHFYLESPGLLQDLVDKLPSQIRLNWGSFKISIGKVNLLTFSNWILEVAEAACEVTTLSFQGSNYRNADNKRTTGRTNVHQEANTTKGIKFRSCVCCLGECSSLEYCTNFKAMDLNNKWNLIKRHYICRTCLRSHTNRKCNVDARCNVQGCTYRHHKLLHKYMDPSTQPIELQTSVSYSSCPNVAEQPRGNINFHQQTNELLFKILPITVFNKDIKIHTYALLDDGSNVTLMDDQLAKDLKLQGELKPFCLKWTSNQHRWEDNSKEVNIQVSGPYHNKGYTMLRVRTVPSLNLPRQTLNFDELKQRFRHLDGIPVEPYANVQPQILIGLDNCKLSNAQRTREAGVNQPSAIKTRLGWTVYGRCRDFKNVNDSNFSYHVCECKAIVDSKLDQLVKGFYTIESAGTKATQNKMSKEDMEAESLLNELTVRVGNRFSVPLLWKSVDVQLPPSRSSAEQRLVCLERRLKKDNNLAINMQQQIETYLSKGYARKLTSDELKANLNKVWYLPIFPVINPNKPNKVRIVWDAAAKVNGISLNSLLLTGPDELPPLLNVLFKFRERRFAICGDIKEMFHQVNVRESDQHSQRFLWRNAKTGELDDYMMQVMTFGATCSPYCAQYVKNKNATEFSSQFPRAVKAILENHYVDDYLDSFSTEKEAIEVATNVKHIHQQGGFEIRNFISNSAEVLKAIQSPQDNQIHQKSLANRLLGQSEKVLGMWWSPFSDDFSYLSCRGNSSENSSTQLPPTKRQVLKTLMSIFDPLGLIAHFLISLKILLQDIWRTAITWDETIQETHSEQWQKWSELLPTIKNLKIKRTYLENVFFDNTHQVQLHIFVDASESASAAVAFFRVTKDFQTECVLVCSKTKVAPLKPISIPRMELEAAVLGTRLSKIICSGHSVAINERFFWTDSQTVLCWIKNSSKKLNQYVSYRVGEILDSSNPSEWRYVPTKQNVADDATRWNPNIDLTPDSRWFSGPSFLYLPEIEWPPQKIDLNTHEEVVLFTEKKEIIEPLIDFSRFSSWAKLRRAVGYVFCFIELVQHRRKKRIPINLLVHDLFRAEKYLYEVCQRESFPVEWDILKNSQNQQAILLNKDSSLQKLSPYMDGDNIIRIRGRIDACIPAVPSCSHTTKKPQNYVSYYPTLPRRSSAPVS